MAKIHEEVVVIKLSKLVKSDSESSKDLIVTEELASALEQVAQELAGESVVIEVEVA